MNTLTRLMATLTLAMTPLSGMAQDSTSATDVETEAAISDVANNSSFGDWVISCDAVTVRRTVCRLIQEQSMRESGELVARFVAVPVADGVILLAQVPMGVYLPGGAVYRIAGRDDLEQREMIWQRCAADVCEAAAPVDDAELALFAEAESLLFGFRPTAESDPVILNVDISEFATAVQLIRESNS